MKQLKTVDKVLCFLEDAVLVAGILSSAIFLFVNVVLKWLFQTSLVWAEEYAKFAIIWITFAGCGAAVRCNAHMRITALLDALGPKPQKALNTCVALVCIAFSVFLVVYGSKVTINLIRTGQTSPSMGLPMWLVYLSLPVGGGLMVVRFLQSLWAMFHEGKEGRD